jgi:hypothetical protein
MKNRSKVKETLRPIVSEALSDYLKDTEQDMRSLQAAHPQLDLKSDLPSETGNGDNVTKGVRTEDIASDVKFVDKSGARVKKVNGKTVIFPANPKNAQKIADALNDSGEYEVEVLKGGGILVKYQSPLTKVEGKVEEASTANANPDMGYQTPYAFSDVGLDKDVKKRKIAQQLGYKIVEKNRLKEEVRVNVVRAVPINEGFQPQLQSQEAKALYDKISYYMMVASDPQYKTIHGFRNAIKKVKSPSDQKQLIAYFNDEFKITWGSAAKSAWDYYADPY